MNQVQQAKIMEGIAKVAHQLDDIVCDNCGSAIVLPVFIIKRLPHLHPTNPTTQDVNVQVPAGQACFLCGQRNTFTKIRKPGEVSTPKVAQETKDVKVSKEKPGDTK